MSTNVRFAHLHNYRRCADLELHLKDGEEDVVLPCHYQILGFNSNVLATMFDEHPKEEWEKGLAAAFEGYTYVDVETYLAANYCRDDKALFEKILEDPGGIVPLANKLDAGDISKRLDEYINVSLSFEALRSKNNWQTITPIFEMACRDRMWRIQQNCVNALLCEPYVHQTFKTGDLSKDISTEDHYLIIQALAHLVDQYKSYSGMALANVVPSFTYEKLPQNKED